jgi:NitT/TauT family transport system substrate-binding protein
VAGVLAGSAAATERLRLIVTHTVPPLVPNSVMDLAGPLGFYAREDLEVEIVRVQQTPLAIAALRNGYGDMANVSISAVLQLVARGDMKLKAVLSPDKTIAFLIAARGDISTLKDLEGRVLGVGRIGSLDYSMTRLVLTRLGLDVDRVKIAALGEPHVRAQALIGGRIDATTMSIGTWSSLEGKTALRMLVGPSAYFRAAPVISKVNVVEDAGLRNKETAIERFVVAILRASRSFATNPERWADAIAPYHPEVSREALRRLARDYADQWSVNGGMNAAQIAFTMDQQYQQPDFEGLRRIAFQEWVDFGPVDMALRRLGTMPDLDEPGR